MEKSLLSEVVKDLADLLTAIATLIGALAWPSLLLAFIILYRRRLGDFLGSLTELSLKAGGVEARAKRQVAELAANLAVAESTKGPNPEVSPERIAEVASAASAPGARGQMKTRRVLWVDDESSNNVSSVRILNSLGVAIEQVRSTDEALLRLESRVPDLVISDMGRPPDPQAGYTLLKAMRSRGLQTPFVIFALGGSQSANRRMATENGAFGSTNSVTELIELVMAALERGD